MLSIERTAKTDQIGWIHWLLAVVASRNNTLLVVLQYCPLMSVSALSSPFVRQIVCLQCLV